MSRTFGWVLSLMMVGGMVLLGPALSAERKETSHAVTMSVVGVSMLDLDDSSPIALRLYVPLDASAVPIGETNSSKRLRYTVVAEAGRTKRIQVRLDGEAPSGTALRVDAVAARAGTGTPVVGGVTLMHSEQTLISGIASGATGRSAGAGVGLRYSIVAVDASRLRPDSTTSARIVYTLTDD